MSNYSQTTDFSAKDALSSGDPNKIIYGADIDTELSAISTAISSKSNKVSSATNNNVAKLDTNGDLVDSGYRFTNLSGPVTPTAAELNVLDGATATTTEINLLSGLTGTIWTSNNDGSGSGLDADTVDGNGASALLSRSNHTGSQTMSTISDAGNLATADTVGQAELESNSVGQSEVKTTYQTINSDDTYFTATGGAYVMGHTMQGNSAGNNKLTRIRDEGSSTSFVARWYWESTSSITINSARLYYINSSPPYDLGDGEVGGFIEARIDKIGNIKALSVSPDPAWAYNGPTDQTPSRYRKNHDGTHTPFIKRKDMSKLPMTLKQAMESGDTVAIEEYMDFFRNAEDIEFELTPQMKNSDMDVIPSHLTPESGETVVLLDPMSDLVHKILTMRESHDQFNDTQFIREYCTVGNTPLSRKGPKGVMVTDLRMKNTSR